MPLCFRRNPYEVSTPIEPSDLTTRRSTSTVTRLLHQARIKLLDPDVPMQLKATSYLRLCCIAMRKLYPTFSIEEFSPDPNLVTYPSYSDLLKTLCQHRPGWWQSCQIDESGTLQSSDPVIEQLLQRIRECLHPQRSESE